LRNPLLNGTFSVETFVGRKFAEEVSKIMYFAEFVFAS